MRRLGVLLLLCGLALGGCESSQEKSAQLEKQAKLAKAAHPVQAAKGLSIAHASSAVRVVATQTVHSSEGTAVVVTLRNVSTHALRDVPIAVTVKGAGGSTLYQNNIAGLEAALTAVPLLPAGAQFEWIDDQVQAAEAPASASALVGEAQQAPATVPQIALTGVHANEEGGSSGVAGTVHNDSAVTQSELVVYGLARRGARIVAAGRAVLSKVAAHGSSPFQVLFIGSASGAHVEASALPSTF
ncbi:MAG TPA: hypothetical protein VG147_12560 [Solirubrobacteraceae bacterium]|jgi:hypothetical protein|nr:hypothetical protein [Solirubrobacteraceae bacterium]